MLRSEPPIIVEEVYQTSLEQLWRAITVHEEMVAWFFENIPDFKAEVGFETKFPIDTGERTFTHNWKVIQVSPMESIRYTWNYDEYPGDSWVEFALSEETDRVKLRVTCMVLEDFPEDIPEFKRESGIGGWEYFLRERLKPYLESK